MGIHGALSYFYLSMSDIRPFFAKKAEALYFGFFVFISPNEKHFLKGYFL